jgi:hypothetical protein
MISSFASFFKTNHTHPDSNCVFLFPMGLTQVMVVAEFESWSTRELRRLRVLLGEEPLLVTLFFLIALRFLQMLFGCKDWIFASGM